MPKNKKKEINEEKEIQKEILQKLKVSSYEDLRKAIGSLTQTFLETALNEEFNEHMGYEKYDQSSRDVSNNYRKGKTKKSVNTESGKLTIEVPRDENASFEPVILPKHQRNMLKVEEFIVQLYAKGTSVRDIEELVANIYKCQISKDMITRITDKLLPEIRSWQQRPLESIYPIMFIDGIRFKVRMDGIYQEKSVYVIIGINTEGLKEIIGFWISESESAKQWLTIFKEIKLRGVNDVLLVCSDNLKGISEAIQAVFSSARIQKCVIHQIRNSLKYVSPTDKQRFTADMKNIYKSNSFQEAKLALHEFAKKWSSKYKYAVESWERNFDELTTFFDFPLEIRKLIYTTNTIENVNRNIRLITKTKGGFTNEQSLIKLIYLRLMDIQDEWNKRTQRDWTIIFQQLRILFPNKLCDIN